MAAAALLMTLSGGAFAAPLPIPVPTIPGLALVQLLPAGGLGALPALPSLSLILPGGIPAAPAPVVLLVGNLLNSLSPYAGQLPLVGLVQAGDPFLRPIITPLSDVVYIPVVGAAFDNN
jgi:hypothetical protein